MLNKYIIIIGFLLTASYCSGQGLSAVRYGLNDLTLDNISKSFISQNGDTRTVILDEANTSEGAGFALAMPISNTLNIGFQLGYRNSTLILGNNDFRVLFSDQNMNKLAEADASVEYFNMNIDLGIAIPLGRNQEGIFQIELSPIVIQYGSILYPNDAIEEFNSTNGNPGGHFNIDSELHYGFRGGITLGIGLGQGCVIGPSLGYIRSLKLVENRATNTIEKGSDWINSFDAGLTIGILIE